MTLTLYQDVMSHQNVLYASKGEKVELISDNHFPVLLVRNIRGNSFSVKAEGTDYKPRPIVVAGAICGKCGRVANACNVSLPEAQEKQLNKRFGRICDDCRKDYLEKSK
jgi:hypothetical protein